MDNHLLLNQNSHVLPAAFVIFRREYRAEVALLSRNILFTSDAQSVSTRIGM